MTVRLSAVVMAHPDRIRYAHRLRDRHPELDLRIVVDPAPGEDCGALRTARLAWDAVAPDATHHLVLQDDTLLCPSFRQHLERAIAARPDHALSLYTEWGSETSYAARLAALLGSAWADVIDEYVPTQALVLPANVARAFSSFSGYEGPLDDFAMRLFLAAAGVPAVMTVPNLAEDARLPSVVGHDFLGERLSVCFRADGLDDVCWSEAVRPATVPVFSFTIGQSYSVVRADGTARGWRRVTTPAIQQDGSSPEAMFDLGREAVRQIPAQARVIGPKLLIGLWLTACGIGQTAATLCHADPAEVDQVLARPTVRRALATMPHGALRFLVDDHQLAEHSSHLSRLVIAGVRQGYRAVPPQAPGPSVGAQTREETQPQAAGRGPASSTHQERP